MKENQEILEFKGDGLPKDATDVMHYFPYAYCIAKPGIHCAVFVCPPQKNRFDDEFYSDSHIISHETAEIAVVGKWYSLAYCSFKGGGWSIVLKFQPNAVKE